MNPRSSQAEPIRQAHHLRRLAWPPRTGPDPRLLSSCAIARVVRPARGATTARRDSACASAAARRRASHAQDFNPRGADLGSVPPPEPTDRRSSRPCPRARSPSAHIGPDFNGSRGLVGEEAADRFDPAGRRRSALRRLGLNDVHRVAKRLAAARHCLGKADEPADHRIPRHGGSTMCKPYSVLFRGAPRGPRHSDVARIQAARKPRSSAAPATQARLSRCPSRARD